MYVCACTCVCMCIVCAQCVYAEICMDSLAMGYVRTSSTPEGFACTDIECFNGAEANWLTVSVFYMTVGGYIYFWRHCVYVCMHVCA